MHELGLSRSPQILLSQVGFSQSRLVEGRQRKSTYLIQSSTPFHRPLQMVHVALALTIHLRESWPNQIFDVDFIPIKQAMHPSGML